MPQLTWFGDHEAKRTARKVPYRLLDPVDQAGDPASANLLIQGKVWASLSAGRCLFAMVTDPQKAGKSVATQLREAMQLRKAMRK